MLIQPIANQINYRNYQQQKVNRNISFKGELGQKVLTKIDNSATKDGTAIMKILKGLGIGFMGLVSMSTLRDVLESVFEKKSEFENGLKNRKQIIEKEHSNNKKELESQKQAFEGYKNAEQEKLDSQRRAFEGYKNAEQEKLESQKRAFEETTRHQEAELDKRREDLKTKEDELIHTEHILKQGEIDAIKGSLRMLYGIKEENIESYDSLGEQTIQVIDIINKSKDNCINVSDYIPVAINILVKTLQNNDKKITTEALSILEKITAMHDYNLLQLVRVIQILKDKFGDLDLNISSHFIALYSLKNADLELIGREIAKEYQPSLTKLFDPGYITDIEFLEVIKEMKSYKQYSEQLPLAELLENSYRSDYTHETKQIILEELNKEFKKINYNLVGPSGQKVYTHLQHIIYKIKQEQGIKE